MECSKILDMVYEDDSMPLLNQVQVWAHTFFCSACAQKIKIYEAARLIMKNDFFQPAESLENSIMTKVFAEEEQAKEAFATPGGISTRGWVIAGIIILVSFASAFFGLDFQNLASEWGMSFMLPMGITIGIVLTTYGALFIGSHLKELSERFGL